MGRAMFTVIAAMAELEHSIIRERVIAGLDHAARNGTKSGNPAGRPRVVIDRERVRQLRDIEKLSWREIGRKIHASSASARRAYAQAVELSGACQNSVMEAV
jgi:DNA invertase Pin-like site-specific DNA recombinase